MDALIGYTGFVGSNLARQRKFDKNYNSTNIGEIEGQEFNTLVCAGVSGTKWLANKHPHEDLARINLLLHHLAKVRCKKLILISTVDVYADPVQVDEVTPLTTEGLNAYGRNRVFVEEWVRDNFPNHLIVRLPAIYGEGLKKNFVYDLIHRHCLDWTHRDSVFQYYHLKHLWQDIATALKADISLINFNAEPISARDLARECFDLEFTNTTPGPPLRYDVRSIWTHLFSRSEYMYTRAEVLRDLATFISRNKTH